MHHADRATRILLALLVLGVWALALSLLIDRRNAQARGQEERDAFREIDVQRINIVDAAGKTRLVIACAAGLLLRGLWLLGGG